GGEAEGAERHARVPGDRRRRARGRRLEGDAADLRVLREAAEEGQEGGQGEVRRRARQPPAALVTCPCRTVVRRNPSIPPQPRPRSPGCPGTDTMFTRKLEHAGGSFSPDSRPGHRCRLADHPDGGGVPATVEGRG